MQMVNKSTTKNILSFDIEEWFHTSALARYISPDNWQALESRVVPQTRRTLEILEAKGVKATFFVLGWVAERHPGLVREIQRQGHEIASHGYRHSLIYHLAPRTFRDYTRRAKQVIEDLIGQPVWGYRATSFSVMKKTLWSLDVIREAGFVYDSSIYPVLHDIYGIDGFPRFPFTHDNGLIEIPLATLRLFGRNVPVAGGGYLRLYPYWLTKEAIWRLNRAGWPAVIYLHPWELDPQCPRVVAADWKTHFRQYVNLHRTEARLHRLLEDFAVGTVWEYVQDAQLATSLVP